MHHKSAASGWFGISQNFHVKKMSRKHSLPGKVKERHRIKVSVLKRSSLVDFHPAFIISSLLIKFLIHWFSKSGR